MDRISKALELAKKAGAPFGQDNNLPEEEIESKKPLSYTKTRVVELSENHLREHRIITCTDHDIQVDSYGLLRTRILQVMRQNNWKTLGITSPDPAVGKTVTAINLAISIAMEGNQTVLLVDADMRKPGVSNKFGIEPEFGLNDYLTGEKHLEDILLHPSIDGLVVVPTKSIESGTSELLSSPRMIRFVQRAKARYPERLILFDLPPLLVGDDVLALLPHLDAVLLVVEDGKTQANDLMHASELLQGTNIAGVVLNKSTDIMSDRYSYYK